MVDDIKQGLLQLDTFQRKHIFHENLEPESSVTNW